MPGKLKRGKSPATIKKNIEELHTGTTHAHTEARKGRKAADRQSLAIALETARRSAGAGGPARQKRTAHPRAGNTARR